MVTLEEKILEYQDNKMANELVIYKNIRCLVSLLTTKGLLEPNEFGEYLNSAGFDQEWADARMKVIQEQLEDPSIKAYWTKLLGYKPMT